MRATAAVQFGCFWTNGQICSATSRLLVHERIADKFHTRLKLRAESIKIGDPLDEECRLGPVVAKSQLSKIMAFIKVGPANGCARHVKGTDTSLSL